ncbi:MAG: PE-PPE domain-containing protein [Nitrososphaeraceae archaeon]
MNSKLGMFSVLAFSVTILLIPASSSLVNAQEYDDRYYEEGYSNDHKYENYGENNIEKLMLSDDELELINEILDQSGSPFVLTQVEDFLLFTDFEGAFGDTTYFFIPTETLPLVLPIMNIIDDLLGN